MAEEKLSSCIEKSEKLKQNIQLFLSGTDSGTSSPSCVERTRCAVVLLQSLPCSRFAVLEQMCEVFHDAVHKNVVELERRHLSDLSGAPNFQDCDQDDALQTVCEVVRSFIDNNARAWAPLICEWSLNLLGQLMTKFTNRKGVVSVTEGWHNWMLFPAIQMLMDIAAHCCENMVNNDADVCVECMVQTAMKYSPHLEWIVAHIGAHFHHVIIEKLLMTALKAYNGSLSTDDNNKTVLISTIVQVLNYLSVQHGQEIKENVLALFRASVGESSSCEMNQTERLATVPFLLHVALLSTSLVKGTVEDFIDVLSPKVLVYLYEQSEERQKLGNQELSLISSLVNVISIVSEGSFKIFVFLLESAEPLNEPDMARVLEEDVEGDAICNQAYDEYLAQHESDLTCPEVLEYIKLTDDDDDDDQSGRGTMEFSSAQGEIQNVFVLILELLLQRLQEITSQRHKLYTKKPEPVPLLALPSAPDVAESSFLRELENHCVKLLTMFLAASGKRLLWLYRVLMLVAVHNGEPTASEILSQLLLRGKVPESLWLFSQFQSELEWYFPSVMSSSLSKCMVQIKSAAHCFKSLKVVQVLQNFIRIIQEEQKIDLPRSKLDEHLLPHYGKLTKLVESPQSEVSNKALELLLALNQPSVPSALSCASTCRSFVRFFFTVLHQLAKQEKVTKDIITQIKLCKRYLLQLSKDEICRTCLLRLLVEGIFEKSNAVVLSTSTSKFDITRQEEGSPCDSERSHSLLEYNRRPHISSRLPLTAASVFFRGTIGVTNKSNIINGDCSKLRVCSVAGFQVWLDVLYSICVEQQETDPVAEVTTQYNVKMRSTDLDFLATLLMESVCPNMVSPEDEWPDEENLKFTVERDLKMRKVFDDNPILWTVLQLVATGEGSLCICAPIIANMLATLMSYWEVSRSKRVTHSLDQLETTGMLVQMMAQADWLPAPLSRIGEVLHILTPKEVYTVVNTIWKVLRENPPRRNSDKRRWQHGAAVKQKEVVKAIFVKNIAQLGHHYARVFQDVR